MNSKISVFASPLRKCSWPFLYKHKTSFTGRPKHSYSTIVLLWYAHLINKVSRQISMHTWRCASRPDSTSSLLPLVISSVTLCGSHAPLCLWEERFKSLGRWESCLSIKCSGKWEMRITQFCTFLFLFTAYPHQSVGNQASSLPFSRIRHILEY